MNDLSVWRVEWYRLLRTRRLLALTSVFVLFGFTGPLVARYSQELLDHVGGAGQTLTIVAAAPVPADGVSGYVGNALQIGLIVAVVVAASACSVDAGASLSTFYRSRARSFGRLLVPRAAVTAAGAVGGWLTGLLVSWYETAVLIGSPDAAAMARTAVTGSAFLVFAVAVTALASTWTRSTMGAAGYALVVLLTSPLLGALPALSRWVPSTLASAPDGFLRHTAGTDARPALAVTVLLAAGCVLLAVRLGARREVR